jgi:hypothetical protein
VHGAAFRGNTSLVADHIIADDKCVHKKSNVYNTFLLARFCMFAFQTFTSVICSCRGQSPLHWSSHTGHVEVSRIIVKCGSDVNATDNVYDTPFDMRSRIQGLSFRHLIPLSTCFRSGSAALHYSSRHGHLEATRFLVECKANVAIRNRYHRSLPSFAACRGAVVPTPHFV